MEKDLSRYIDNYGLLVQSNGDGGDSCNRSFAYCYFTGKKADKVYAELETAPGLLRRSPHPGKWYSMPERLSRDQFIPALACLIRQQNKPLLERVAGRHARRGYLFAWNTRRNFQYPTLDEHLRKSTPDVEWNYSWKVPDFCGPAIWAMYSRAFGERWGIRRYLGDLETLVNSLIVRLNPKRDDVINHLIILHLANNLKPTKLARLARLITPYDLLLKRMDTFFGKDQEPPLNEIVREALANEVGS